MAHLRGGKRGAPRVFTLRTRTEKLPRRQPEPSQLNTPFSADVNVLRPKRRTPNELRSDTPTTLREPIRARCWQGVRRRASTGPNIAGLAAGDPLCTARSAKSLYRATPRCGALGWAREKAAHRRPPCALTPTAAHTHSIHARARQVTTASFAELLKSRTRPQRYGPAEIYSQPVTEAQVAGFRVALGKKV